MIKKQAHEVSACAPLAGAKQTHERRLVRPGSRAPGGGGCHPRALGTRALAGGPMLSLDALVDAARPGGIRRPGVVATRPTTEGEFFARPFDPARIELVRPEEADGAFVHEVYFGELVKGRFTDQIRARLVDVIERMKTRHDVDAVILGGTELPPILREPRYAGVPVLNATGVHVQAAIDWLRSVTTE